MTFCRLQSIAIACALVLTRCALPNTMPPFATTASAARAPAPPASAKAQLRALGTVRSRSRTRAERDSATDQTRVSLTTHHGTYFLWVQNPRITFFYVYSGRSLEHAPPSVFLVFRTHEPQVPSTNQLTLNCDQVDEPQAATPTFAFEPRPLVTNRVFTYELPLAIFARFAGCNTAALRVGEITAHFSASQLAELRAFAGGMRGRLDEP
jgi:hypothetical protein